MSNDVPARIAILFDPAGKSRGVGPDAIEGLLTTWLKTPTALGHREDGSPYLIGIEEKYLSLSHATGMTALAISDRPVGIDVSPAISNPADRKVAARLFAPTERNWLSEQQRADQPAAFALLWTLKEAVLKRDRQGLDGYDLPDVSPFTPTSMSLVRPRPMEWHAWMALAQSPRQPAGLLLGLPSEKLERVNGDRLAAALLETPSHLMALSLAWT